MNKVVIPRTTLCCIDTRDHEPALIGIRHCTDQCQFERVLFLTDRAINVEGVEVIPIDPIKSRREYSRFVIKGLNPFIETDFVLIVQYDGFILDGQLWRDEYQHYDYIGARWGGSRDRNVGNGGFSLRSKRLLEALQDKRMAGLHPEDAVICVTYRPLLEREHGINFAPGEMADSFSWERMTPPHAPSFGFHDRGHPPLRLVPQNNPPEILAVAQRITRQPFVYQREGKNKRPLDLLADGTIKLARADFEKFWSLVRVGSDVLLTLSSERELVCELKEYPDRSWRGRWLTYEKMPVALHPSGS